MKRATQISRSVDLFKKYFACPRANPRRAESGQQTISKFMKNKPNKTTDVRDLSAEAEHTVLDGHVRQRLKQVEGNVAAHETARPAEVRFARRDCSVLQPATCQRRVCSRCPRRLDSCRSFCCW